MKMLESKLNRSTENLGEKIDEQMAEIKWEENKKSTKFFRTPKGKNKTYINNQKG